MPNLLVKATLILVLALIATHLARHARASVRHALLAAALGALLILPVVPLLLPPVSVQIPVSQLNPFAALQMSRASDADAIASASPESNRTPAPSQRRGSLSLGAILRAAWAGGSILLLVVLATALRQVHRIGRSGVPWLDGDALVARLASDAGIRRKVHVMLQKDVVAPMTCGLRRPVIVLPADAQTWPRRDVEHAIVHELEHVYRVDWVFLLLSRIVCALYWFHPLVWIASRRLALEAERACDDAVLRGGEVTAYAEQLVAMARQLMNHDSRPVLSMANRSDLSARIAAVLDRSQRRGRPSLLFVATIVCVLVVVMLTIAPLAVAERVVGLRMAQQPSATASTPAFEAASIKLNKSGERAGTLRFLPGGRLEVVNYSLGQLIRNANQLEGFQLVGGPGWIDSDRYDIVAKAEGNPGPTQMMIMVRTLLDERFKLVTHRETRDFPVYALVMAKNNGTLGPQLRRAAVPECPPFRGPMGSLAGTPPSREPPCGSVGPGPSGGGAMGRTVPISELARRLVPAVGRPIIDRTELEGRFDLNLEFMRDRPAAPSDAAGTEPRADSGPSIFTAVQEQLGLKLEATRGPVEVLVIDSVQRPSDDAALSNSPPQPFASQSPKSNANNSAFEVASIKPQKPGDITPPRIGFPGVGRFEAIGATVQDLITAAYGSERGLLRASQIVGGPAWIRSDRFDILAKVPSGDVQAANRPPGREIFLMLRTLLEDRFKLVTRSETRQMPIYALVLAKSDGQLGPKLRRAEDCTSPDAPRLPASPGEIRCGGGRVGSGKQIGRGVPLGPFVNGSLARLVDRVVLDRTGLTGFFDWDLEWAPGPGEPTQPVPDGAPVTESANDGPSLVTALEEQLGLKLESTTGPVEILVIDSVERPSPD